MLPVACKQCGRPYPADQNPFRCPDCGGLFDYKLLPVFDSKQIDLAKPGIWRYRPFLGLEPGAPQVYLGEGDTPLVKGELEGCVVHFKLESLNPSGSYKDRGTAPLISHLCGRDVRRAIEDSSGNAGASFAAYAARAGMLARVFVPESASGPKLNQIHNSGAELVKVAGPRSQAAQAVLREAETGAAYASHAFLPFGLPGIATIAYELFAQLGRGPGTIITPAGHGALLLGVLRGFASLQAAGLIEQLPFAIGVQAMACAPLLAAERGGLAAMEAVDEGATLAEGVRVRWPARAGDLLEWFDHGRRGTFTSATEDEIKAGFQALANLGIYAEPTSALVWAALQQKHLRPKLVDPIVLIISGSGLKSGYTI